MAGTSSGAQKGSATRALKDRIRHLEADNRSLCAKFEEAIDEVKKAQDLLIVTEEALNGQRRNVEFWKNQWTAADAGLKEERARAIRYERERDDAREQLQRTNWTLAGAERERDVARALAEAMREQAFPAPRLPWEPATVLEWQVGNVRSREEHR